MTIHFTEEEVVTAVARLTQSKLLSFVDAQIVVPVHSEKGPVFRQVDVVRIELLCELSDEFDLNDDSLGIVMSLIDQLHGVRAELRAVVDAISDQPANVRQDIFQAVRSARSTR